MTRRIGEHDPDCDKSKDHIGSPRCTCTAQPEPTEDERSADALTAARAHPHCPKCRLVIEDCKCPPTWVAIRGIRSEHEPRIQSSTVAQELRACADECHAFKEQVGRLRTAVMLAIVNIDCERSGLTPDGNLRERLVRVLEKTESVDTGN